MILIWYPKCSTCQKAKKWLDEKKLSYETRHIVDQNPTEEEWKSWLAETPGIELKKLFNTSGLKYKALQLKDKLKDMDDAEKIALLASDGMLVKRPILLKDGKIAAGFKEEAWLALIGK